MLVWALSATQVTSALARKRRDGSLTFSRFAAAKRRLTALERVWNEVAAWEAVRARARRLLEVHPLTVADALQLGSALVVLEERTQGIGFVTFDSRLADAATREGFQVLG
jgi:hypothetical protein